MPLTWNVGKVVNHEHVTTSPATRSTDDEQWHPVTNAIVMSGMVCGYNQITEANYKKIAARLAQYQKACGGLLGYSLMEQVFVTEEDVRMHIGLRMNASAMTDAQWRNNLMRIIERESGMIQNGKTNLYRAPDAIQREGDMALSAYEVCERMHEFYKAKEKTDAKD